ncbi:MAG: tetratricopeptide repeat protein [Woeseiaceae bacterium]|nr:tetratricopeptide repeat protein [Woeseiaceae bacterium]
MPDVKKIAFSFITVVVVPLLFFGLLEFGLRVTGVGTSFDYFHEIDINGEPHYQENPDFADQFYPPSLNIGPVENTFAVEPDPDRVRVFVLGGSAALGFPHKNHGLDRLLETQLRAALPSQPVEVINLAMTSVNSHVVYAVAKSLPADSADFAVILMGNNEVVGPYGPGTFNQNFLANTTLIRGLQALKRTRIWQALDGLIQQLRPTDALQDLEWEGMQMFANNGVPQDDPRMEGVYRHFGNNLADTVDVLRGKGMHVVVSSVPVNLRQSAPFLSVRGPAFSQDHLDLWRERTRQGAESAAAANWNEAVAHFQAALEIDPDYADTHFRLATAFENLGEHDEARAHYERALDLDALRFRADTRINQVIQEIAGSAEGDAFSFVDSAAAFEEASQPFQPGWNLLLEHVHFDFAGNHVLAAGIARAIVSALEGPAGFEPLPAAEVARRVGFPNHDTIAEIENLQGMIQHPPFPGQSNYADLQVFLSGKRERFTTAVGSPADVIERRKDIVRSGLADWKVYFELAVLNERQRNTAAVYYHLNRILELYPHNRESYMKLAEAMSRDGKWNEVIPLLEQSLFYTRGDETKIAETLGWLGTAYLRTGDHEKGTDQLLEVTKNYPEQIGTNLRAYGNLIRSARERSNDKDLDRYARDLQRYARSLQRSGKDKEYPLLNQRMAQLMTMAGDEQAAREWADGQSE